MITYSDNRAADAVYAQVGDDGLEEAARRAGMDDFEATPGFWGGDKITPAFKGGWRPPGQKRTSGPVTHQVALLEHRGGERLALAVLSDEPPGDDGGFGAIRGVAERLLGPPPPHRGGWVAP